MANVMSQVTLFFASPAIAPLVGACCPAGGWRVIFWCSARWARRSGWPTSACSGDLHASPGNRSTSAPAARLCLACSQSALRAAGAGQGAFNDVPLLLSAAVFLGELLQLARRSTLVLRHHIPNHGRRMGERAWPAASSRAARSLGLRRSWRRFAGQRRPTAVRRARAWRCSDRRLPLRLALLTRVDVMLLDVVARAARVASRCRRFIQCGTALRRLAVALVMHSALALGSPRCPDGRRCGVDRRSSGASSGRGSFDRKSLSGRSSGC